MITKEEIEKKSEEFGVVPADVERDYVFGWLLAGIYGQSSLRDRLVLKGGNAFRKAYLPRTRFANDLDFSAPTGIAESQMVEELSRVCDFVQAQSGVVFDKGRNLLRKKTHADKEVDVYEARLYFEDFYGNPKSITISVRLDFTDFEHIYLPIQNRQLIHPYSDASQCQVELRCQKLEELLASKLKCLLQRRHSADLFDFVFSVFISKDVEIDRREIVWTFLRKTIFERAPGVVKALLLDLPFDVIKGLWEKYLVCPKPVVLEFDQAARIFREGVQVLFKDFPVWHGGQLAYFPARLRNPIMEAASNLTLLRVRYLGFDRLVEPYSLVFKRRQDGVAREYFYVYDQTGGKHAPGIKAFVQENIEAMENTTEEFQPRFPVELSKAGEQFGNTYFGSRFGSRRRSMNPYARTIATRRTYGP